MIIGEESVAQAIDALVATAPAWLRQNVAHCPCVVRMQADPERASSAGLMLATWRPCRNRAESPSWSCHWNPSGSIGLIVRPPVSETAKPRTAISPAS